MESCAIHLESEWGIQPAQRYAGEQLKKYLEKAGKQISSHGGCGVTLRLSAQAPAGGGFRLQVAGNQALLESKEPCGLVYGTFTLLEKMGFRFLAPDCDVIPQDCCFPEDQDEIIQPAFAGRELFWREAMEGDFAVRLKLNSGRSSITSEQGGKMPYYNFSHTFEQLVPVEKWYDTHPEYFSMKDGKRLREKEQLCLSNPEVLQLCVEGVKTWAREHPECRIFSVSMNDWYNPCECPACRAIDQEEESQAGSVIRFVNAVADQVRQEFPEILIHTFAYLYCRKPPKHVRPAENVIVRLCTIECCFGHPIAQCGRERGGIDVQYGSSSNFDDSDGENCSAFLRDLEGWSRICNNLYIWDYTVNYANYLLPFPNLKVLQENLRLFRSYGVKGVFEQGNFSLGHSSALGQLKIYLLGKLLWNPEENTEELIKDFVMNYYAGAGEAMMRYVRLWQQLPGDCHIGIYDRPDAPYLTDSVIEEAEEILSEAMVKAENDTVRERIRREALSPAYARLTREDPMTPGHRERVDSFSRELQALGITEIFERKELSASLERIKESRYAADRTGIPGISYPI